MELDIAQMVSDGLRDGLWQGFILIAPYLIPITIIYILFNLLKRFIRKMKSKQ